MNRSTYSTNWDALVKELEEQGFQREANLLRRFPRCDWDDPLVRGMFVAATSISDLNRAEALAHRLISLAPDNPFAHLALCIVYLRQGKFLKASQTFERANYFASTLPSYLTSRVHWFCVLGEIEKTQKFLRQLKREFPDRWETHCAFAHVLMVSGSGKLKKAVELLKRAVCHRPADAIVHALLAQALFRMGERMQADMHFRLSALNLAPLKFTDEAAFVAHIVIKRALSERFIFMRPFWWCDQKLLRFPPQRYFIAVGTVWVSIALILASLKWLLPTNLFLTFVFLATIMCLYTRFADVIILKVLLSSKRFRG